MPFVAAGDGARLWVEDVGGPGAGAPVLLLAGQSLSGSMWGELVGDLSARHRLLVLDARGTGRSDGFDPRLRHWSTERFAADALAVLDGLGIARAHLLGFSMGGRVGQVLGARHGDRLGAVVLAGCGLGGPHDVPRPEAATQALLRASLPAGRAAMLDLMVSPAWAAAHPAWAAALLPDVARVAIRLHFAASTGHDGWDLCPRVGAPTLVLHGADDQLVPVQGARLLASRLTDVRLEVLPGVRHGCVAEARAQTARHVLAHLAAHPL